MINTLLSTSKNYHLYLGFPFCKSKCSFCHYVDNIKFGKTDIDKNYINLLLKQLKEILSLNKCNNLQSVYFGGGTPSLLSFSQLEEIKNLIKTYSNPTEITIEIYPSNWNKHYLELDFFTRYSIGVQSINKNILERYKRKDYKWQDVLKIIQEIQQYNKKLNINLDFLFDENIELQEVKETNNVIVDSIVFYPNTRGRGVRRLKNIYKTLNIINSNITNYNNLYMSKHIFINKNQKIFSLYSQNEYEIFDDIIGVGDNSISSIGNKSFLSLYKDNTYFYKLRHSNRYITSLIESSVTAMKLEKILQIDGEFLKFTEKYQNIYYIPQNQYMHFYEFLLKKYSMLEAETFLTIINYGEKLLFPDFNYGLLEISCQSR